MPPIFHNAKYVVRLSTYVLSALFTITLCVSGGAVMSLYTDNQPAHSVLIRKPDAVVARAAEQYVPVVAQFTPGTGKPSELTGTWSHFRGDQFDAVFHETVKLKRTLPEENPPKRWELPLGEGFAGAAVRNGRVYLIDYDMKNFRDALRCLSLDDGQEIWRQSYPVRIKKNHGMSRTIPAVSDKYCVSLGPKCHLLCTDAMTGQEKWLIDLKHEYGTTEPEWYAGQCPFIVPAGDYVAGKTGEAVIVAPAGPEVLVMALDCETGKEIWRSPNPFGWTMTHTSIVPMDLDGRKTLVYCGKGGVAGVDAADGKILWFTTDWQIEIATCPSPVVCPDNRIFCCGGYLSGSVMLQIQNQDPQGESSLNEQDSVNPASSTYPYKAVTLFRLKDAVFGSEQQTPILYDNHLFGIRQRDKEFVCLSLDGEVVWHSGSKGRFGGGPYLLADGMFLILDDGGKLTACEATTTGYKPLFQSQVLADHGAWAPMAMVNGILLLRDQVTMACLDLRE